MMHVREAISKTRASCFIGVSKHSKTIKALGLRPRTFISFLVGNPDETLALVFDILRHALRRGAPRDGLKRARHTETWWTDRNDIMDVSHSIGTKRIR